MVDHTKIRNKIITYLGAGVGLGFAAAVSGCSYVVYSNQESYEKIRTINQELAHLEKLIVNDEGGSDKWVDSSKTLMYAKLNLICTQEYKSEGKKLNYGENAMLLGTLLITGCFLSRRMLKKGSPW